MTAFTDRQDSLVIFTDIDGVLNDSQHILKIKNWLNEKPENFENYDRSFLIDENKLYILSLISKLTGAKIVLSSSWRIGWEEQNHGIEPLEISRKTDSLFKKYGLCIHGLTTSEIRDWSVNARGCQIKEWLMSHPEVTNYVILDDHINDIRHVENLSAHLVNTKATEGLTFDKMLEALRILQYEKNLLTGVACFTKKQAV